MIKINLYKFTKKGRESTKQPTGTGTELEGQIKEPSSVMRPTIIFSSGIFSDPTAYNYAYIPVFKRYYFINDITWISGRWEVSMECDVMATYKSAIGGTSMFMLRAAAAGNGYIPDALSPITEEVVKYYQVPASESLVNFNQGTYVVQIAGKTTGSSTLYSFSPTQFNTFLNSLYGLYDTFTWTGVEEAIKNSMFRPEDYIYSARWYPGDLFSGSAVSPVYVGYWDSQASGKQLSDAFAVWKTFTLSLNDHPQAASRGKYLNGKPFRTMELFLPPFGIIPIDTDKLVDSTSLYVAVYVDALTGAGSAYGRDENGQKIFYVCGKIGVDLPITSGGTEAGNAISGLMSLAGGAAASMLTGGASIAGEVIAGIGKVGTMLDSSPSTVGSQGSILAYRDYASLATYCRKVSGADWSDCGRPYCVDTTPSSLGGYMLPKEAHVAISGTAEEQALITRICEGGFIYE